MTKSVTGGAPATPAQTMQAHMNYEEMAVVPLLHPDDAKLVVTEHNRYRRMLARGQYPAQSDLAQHEAVENELYDGLPGSPH